jgi:F-type H+-transporting ATPase subunit a
MHLTPDEVVFFQIGFAKVNATIVTTWGVMVFLTLVSWWATRGYKKNKMPVRLRCAAEMIVLGIESQISDIGLLHPRKYVPFIGTLFLFLATSNAVVAIPGCEPPTGSFSTTVVLAIFVFFAVPWFGIRKHGVWGYIKGYFKPVFLMAPFHFISELSRTAALAIRLFGNIMSGSVIIAILLTIMPVFFPVLMTILGLVVGIVQAYIFATLAAVFIAAAVRSHDNS